MGIQNLGFAFAQYLKIKGNSMGCLILLERGLILFPQLIDEQAHLVWSGIGDGIFGTKIQRIPEPLFIVRTFQRQNGSFFENYLKALKKVNRKKPQ